MSASAAPWLLLAAGFAAALLTRAVGVLISGRVQPDTPLFEWFTCVGQALIGGLAVRAVFMPQNPLGEVPMVDRIAAVGIAFAVFLLGGRRLLPSTLAGVAALAALGLWRGV